MKALLAAGVLLITGAASAQVPIKAFGATSNVAMRIWLPGGKLRVQVWDRDSIQVTGTLGRGAHLYAGGSGPSAKIGVDWDDHSNTKIPQGDLVVTVPRKAHVWVKMTDGNVTVTGTEGELDLITVTGTIAVHGAKGVTLVETIDAHVTLDDIGGDVRARTGGGPITLTRIHGTLTAVTVGGAINLTGAALQDARLETIGGEISIAGSVAANALLDLETHSGAIRLAIDRNLVPAFTLTSRAGAVRNPMGPGANTAGRINAYSFKGDINVLPTGGIEGKKATTPP